MEKEQAAKRQFLLHAVFFCGETEILFPECGYFQEQIALAKRFCSIVK